MVDLSVFNPIYIIGIGLAAAFLLGFFHRGTLAPRIIMVAVTAYFTIISLVWMQAFLLQGQTAAQVFTAGFQPPFSINLRMGAEEAFLTLLINISGLLGGIYLLDTLKKMGSHAVSVFIILIMGMNGIIMTRDIFNLFVFMEIVSIAVAGLIVLQKETNSLAAGFKYMIAAGIISVFLLLGIILAYAVGGTLNIDFLSTAGLPGAKAGMIALFFMVIALLLELKPFPANGWALDVYEAAPAGISAILAAAGSATAYYALVKILPLGSSSHYTLVAAAGAVTFLGSNLLGLKQHRGRRLLGYSSVGQIGLLLIILGFSDVLGAQRDYIAAGIILSHSLAKAILFWLAGMLKQDGLEAWAALRKKPILLILFGSAVFALVGFPPFPSFFAKWELILLLNGSRFYLWSAVILGASFLEAVYLFRWFGYALKMDTEGFAEPEAPLFRLLPPIVFGILLYGAGWYMGSILEGFANFSYIPLAFILLLALIDRLPAWIKNTVSIAGVTFYIIDLYPRLEGDLLRLIFAGIFLVGAVLTLLSGYYYKGRRAGFYPLALTMFAGLAVLIEAANLLEFFYGWELMTIGSYFLLIRGKKSMPHGYSYMLFSVGGSFAMLFGFSLAAAGAGSIAMSALTGVTVLPMLAYSLMLVGFLTKTASVGLHIWLPGAHGEAVADIHFMASAILLKAGVFGLITVLLGMGAEASYTGPILFVLGWIGALSALLGNISASFQESAKRLLAWSSIGQLGYIVFGLATMSHLGWLIAISYSVTHFLYKGILFLVIGGIALKLGTPYMYKMGGLIKRMPFSFLAVLIAIITLSGVPPLVGFAAKWITYNLIISERIYYQGFIVLISGIVAFLYLFRMIYTMFLGQLKDNLRTVREINIWFLIPVYLLLGAIMVLSIFPNMLLRPVGEMLSGYFPDGAIAWTGTLGTTRLGYYDGGAIMYVIGGIFVAALLFFFSLRKRTQQVKQFNIFYSGEAPSRPELSHFSYNFFAHYQKAIGVLTLPLVTNFWNWLSGILHGAADFFRRIYTGNGQTYAYHLVLYIVVVFFLQRGGM